MSESKYRPELPPVPKRMQRLPIRRGYPVPWFVPIVDGDYYFPAADGRKMALAVKEHRCWVCGQQLGRYLAFVLGPMCAINRTTSEPPNHRECAIFAATACPFMARPHMKRRQDQPEDATPPAGVYLDRNPGCTLVWITRKFWVRPVEQVGNLQRGGILFKIGDPAEVQWFAEGRAATREEVLASIDSGYPLLHKVALEEGADAVLELQDAYRRMMHLLPAPEVA